MPMRSTVGHSADGFNLVFEKLKVYGNIIEAILFCKPDFSFSGFSS